MGGFPTIEQIKGLSDVVAQQDEYGVMPFRRFSSIDQFRHVVLSVKHRAEYVGRNEADEPLFDVSRAKPVLTFKGTVKLHGTNCGVSFNLVRDTFYAQSRDRILSTKDDHLGFCALLEKDANGTGIELLRNSVVRSIGNQVEGPVVSLTVYGEYCGPEVNRKAAIGNLPARWVIFGVQAGLSDETECWLSVERVAEEWRKCSDGKDSFMYFVTDYPTYRIDIDFNNPAAVLDTLESLTLGVEAECPVAKEMGFIGIGEGIVWECDDKQYGYHQFKTKGTKHKGTKNSRLVQIEPEVLASIDDFINAVLTDSRLEQGFEQLQAEVGVVVQEHLGRFLKWIGTDVLKEEADTLEASGLERKQVMGRVNQRAKSWFVAKIST